MANVASATATAANYRSVTPAMNNVRRGVGASSGGTSNNMNKMNGGRYTDSFNPHQQQLLDQSQANTGSSTPSSTGLLRLTLRKPMGIVFEPMYDPNSPSIQRGVRICDLPRTGAAALSRKLEVGDELLSINDKTMSRLTFDEIMDFIIEADPEEVNLLFRRPRKEQLNARHGINLNKASNPNGPGVKWIDDEARNINGNKVGKPETSNTSSRNGGKKDRKVSRKNGGGTSRNIDDETLQSEDNDYSRGGGGRNSRGRKGRRRKDPYESESFLDILIDTICANPDSVCRDRRRGDEDYYSDDDETFASRDDSTYVTYESEDRSKVKKKNKAKQVKGGKKRDDDSSEYDETEEDTLDDKRGGVNITSSKREKESGRLFPPTMDATEGLKSKPEMDSNKKNSGKYEDDGTLETVDSDERQKAIEAAIVPEQTPPLGLAPNPEPAAGPVLPSDTDDDGNPAPIKTVEYDDMDNGADVSVMESLGGPSLLIEKQRQAAAVVITKVAVPPVPTEIIDNFGKQYPLDFGFTREQTIQNDPLRFYTFVVKGLLQEHEPEKVRLLDKLLAKYRGREDHLVQKLSVRYNKEDEDAPDHEENGLGVARSFEDAVNQGKGSAHANAAIQTARERLQNDEFQAEQWPEKESKETDENDEHNPEMQSESGTEFSGDSIDGTSPAVIAQVSELLNYVYGKTSVPGQIDRVSTIMRAYEGREAVLLELLETKALIKANREKENAGQLPSFLRNSASAQRNIGNEMSAVDGDVPPVTPMATQAAINDDISSMSGVSSPAEGHQHVVNAGVLKQITSHEAAPHQTSDAMNSEANIGHEVELPPPTPSSQKSKSVRTSAPEKGETKKKKKGIFGGLFGGKKGKKTKDNDKSERTTSRTRGLRSPMARKVKNTSETSI